MKSIHERLPESLKELVSIAFTEQAMALGAVLLSHNA